MPPDDAFVVVHTITETNDSHYEVGDSTYIALLELFTTTEGRVQFSNALTKYRQHVSD